MTQFKVPILLVQLRKSGGDDIWWETSSNFKRRINTEFDVGFSQISFSHQLGTMGGRIAVSRRVVLIGLLFGSPTACGETTAVFRTLTPKLKRAKEC